MSQHDILKYLEEKNDWVTVKEIMSVLKMTKSSTNRKLLKLLKRKEIRREKVILNRGRMYKYKVVEEKR